MLSLQKIGMTYKERNGVDKTVLKDFSLDVDVGCFVTIVGPSGCGKTTILKIIAGLIKNTNGVVISDGEIISKPSSKRGMVFQSYTCYPWLTVSENVAFGLRLNEILPNITEATIKYINLVNMMDYRDYYPGSLSGGMQQRVAIARTLAARPDILMMDEPFGSLDYFTRISMQELLLNIWRNTGVTIIFVTHDIEEAIYLSQRIIIMTPSPGSIATIIDIPNDLIHNYEFRSSVECNNIKALIYEIIKNETHSIGTLGDTLIGDN